MIKMMKKTTNNKALQEPLAQIEQPASFDLTVITSASSFDDNDVNIKVVPYIDEESPPQEEEPPSCCFFSQQRMKKISKYSIHCGSFSLSALKASVVLVLLLLVIVFVVVLAKSGKAFGKW